MENNSFLHRDRPVITAMIKSKTVKEVITDIGLALKEGVDAFGLQVETLAPTERTESNLKEIYAAMCGKPAYVTDYYRFNDYNEDMTDDMLAEELLFILSCGGTLADVRGDLFNAVTEELTLQEKAIEKQKEFIKEIHKMGKEVLMSSHVMRYIPQSEVINIAKAHEARGADISKIVTGAETAEESNNNFTTGLALNREIKIGHLFLCNGSMCRKHRLIGPTLGDSLFLCVQEGVQNTSSQPLIKEARLSLLAAGFTDLPKPIL